MKTLIFLQFFQNDLTKILNLSNNDFIRTTEKRHHKSVEDLWNKLVQSGDIYLDKYKGWYSVSDEAYYDNDEIEDRDGTKIAKSSGYPFSGEVSYRRWRHSELPKRTDDNRLKFSVRPDVFKYAQQKDPKIVDWHLNFADPDLFVAYGSELLAQDEIQVAEHPILGSIREMLISKKYYAETLDDDGCPTPITITGAQRRCVINTQPNPKIGCPNGIYGNATSQDLKELREEGIETETIPWINEKDN